MKHESVVELLTFLNNQFPYSVARWIKDNTDLHITVKDSNSSVETIKKEKAQ